IRQRPHTTGGNAVEVQREFPQVLGKARGRQRFGASRADLVRFKNKFLYVTERWPLTQQFNTIRRESAVSQSQLTQALESETLHQHANALGPETVSLKLMLVQAGKM